MKRSHKVVLGLVAVLGLGTAAAYAHNAGGGPCGGGPAAMAPGKMGGRMMPGNPVAHLERRLSNFKQALKISPEQETAWQAFAGEVERQAASMQAPHREMGPAPQAAPDRMSQRTEFMKQRLAGMENVSEAFKKLYSVLTPEQKAIADSHFGHMRG